MDELLEPASGLLVPPQGMDGLWWLAGLYLMSTLLGSALTFLNMYVMARTGQAAMRDLRRDVLIFSMRHRGSNHSIAPSSRFSGIVNAKW